MTGHHLRMRLWPGGWRLRPALEPAPGRTPQWAALSREESRLRRACGVRAAGGPPWSQPPVTLGPLSDRAAGKSMRGICRDSLGQGALWKSGAHAQPAVGPGCPPPSMILTCGVGGQGREDAGDTGVLG